MVSVVDYRAKEMIFMVNVTSYTAPSKQGNVFNALYYVGPYDDFHYEDNPIIVVHDHAKGVYFLNLRTK